MAVSLSVVALRVEATASEIRGAGVSTMAWSSPAGVLRRLAGRMLAGQQHVEQHAQRIDVGRRRDRQAGELLGGRELRRQHAAGLARQLRRATCALIVEQRGDAEIEELDHAVAGDQHVGGLDVAVHDQVRVRVRHRRQHVEEQPQPRLDAEATRVAVAVDLFTLDALQHQVRLSGRRDACVEQRRDVRMGEASEDVTFTPEALPGGAADQGNVEQLDRDLGLVAAVAAVGEPDAAHAAVAERLFERVGAKGLAGERRAFRRGRTLLEIAGRVERVGLAEQDFELRRERRVARTQAGEPLRPLRLGGAPARGRAADSAAASGRWPGARASRSVDVVAERAPQVEARLQPVALDRALGHAAKRRDLGHREAAEVLEVDEFGERCIHLREGFECFADLRRIGGSRRLVGDVGVERGQVERAAALLRMPVARIVDDQAAHSACRVRHEPRTVRIARRITLREVEVRFVEQRGCAERHPDVAPQLPLGEPVQLVVERPEERFRRRRQVALSACRVWKRRRHRLCPPARAPHEVGRPGSLPRYPPQAGWAIMRGSWGRSSAGRASRSQCEGREFDPPRLHQASPNPLIL